jgi:hypothetical protein
LAVWQESQNGVGDETHFIVNAIGSEDSALTVASAGSDPIPFDSVSPRF